MVATHRELIGDAMDLLKSGLLSFVSREFTNHYKKHTQSKLREIFGNFSYASNGFHDMDVAALLKVMWESWNDIYRNTLGYTERSLVSELRDVRNKWAHQSTFTSDDTYRALDSIHRLLLAVSAPESAQIEEMKMNFLRRRYDEYARTQRRKVADASEIQIVAGNLVPWRDVINPHDDVASGRYQQAEFAADLWQVRLGKGSSEYKDPVEFFHRTYLTSSLKQLLDGAIQRLAGTGGDPVVQIQTNFGGGKTHAMLALYHLFSGTTISKLAGMDEIIKDGTLSYTANRVVLVGNKISPGSPDVKPDGTKVRTLWGELAWQLGYEAGGMDEARRAFERVQADDEKSTNPGDALRELLDKYGPALILIDEWVAYARQLRDEGDLPAGSFETQFTFAQALSESAIAAKNCLVVVSLPASDASEQSHPQTDDIEVGGTRGRAALARLHNVLGRVESSWRPASADESFEIVRRRLFQPITDVSNFTTRDNVARAFRDLYGANKQEFPSECANADYEKRIVAAYPIHPEVFERLYADWSTLQNFQRTRGVLRLMASVIHNLWEKGDQSPLILPSNISLEDSRVQAELTHYLPENWVPVIESDIDGPNSTPRKLDGEIPNLGKHRACRRVARSIYLGSAPLPTAANKGVEDRRIKLGCTVPGESPAVFGDAIRRLAGAATYMYQDGTRYWYSTQPTVAKLAESRADEYMHNREEIHRETRNRLEKNLKNRGDFNRIHVFPVSGQDVQDDKDAGLVILDPSVPYEKGSDNQAVTTAREILESKGNSPRFFKNTLSFLAADHTHLQDLEADVGMYLAWKSILGDKDTLNLPPNQVRQAQSKLSTLDESTNERVGDVYCRLLVPTQKTPQSNLEWQSIKLSGQDPLAVLASKKMIKDELLVTDLAGTRLRMELDKIPLWRGGDNVEIQQLVDDFARYSYLPMLKTPSVLLGAIRKGLPILSWEVDSFAYADSYDDTTSRYRGLQTGQAVASAYSETGLLVHPAAARRQMDAEVQDKANTTDGPDTTKSKGPIPKKQDIITGGGSSGPIEQVTAKRYHGSVTLDKARVGPAAGQIAEEVIAHLTSLLDANVKLTLHIDAKIPAGVPKNVERVIIENSRNLNFDDSEFEME